MYYSNSMEIWFQNFSEEILCEYEPFCAESCSQSPDIYREKYYLWLSISILYNKLLIQLKSGECYLHHGVDVFRLALKQIQFNIGCISSRILLMD